MSNKQEIINKNINIEIRLLLEAIYEKFGYDFRSYSKAHVKRRILYRLSASELKSVSEMQYKVLYEDGFIDVLLKDLSINVTEMFRDPLFYKAIRDEIIPIIKTYPFFKIWHAGCSTGEEVYSMAIILKEEGIYDRAQIYATDFNQLVLKKAKEGIYHIDKIKEYTRNYQKSGGVNSFSDYYMAKYDSVILDKSLKKNIVFADHNLVSDSVFGEMNMIICRNVLIYFNSDLQNNVVKLFEESLIPGGFLCLGSKENLKLSAGLSDFKAIDDKEKIFKKKLYI